MNAVRVHHLILLATIIFQPAMSQTEDALNGYARDINGEMIGKATEEVIEACKAAAMVGVIMPTITASAITSR